MGMETPSGCQEKKTPNPCAPEVLQWNLGSLRLGDCASDKWTL